MTAAKKGERVYSCYYVSGGGNEYEEGDFLLEKETSKTLFLRRTSTGYFSNFPEVDLIKIPKVDNGAKRTKFCPSVKFWGDGSFTVYHNAAGTPYVYTPRVRKAGG